MKKITVMQECECCGITFPAIYYENGSIDYSDACNCESDFHPVSGQPSISEWLENRKEQ
ncbi:hypothetical protein [Blautia sp. 1033sp1_1033st1_G9_1033SCRN_220408]|uniref:hypothetical protein n=1 Tax=Blautia sp. 1033sp1_1033st1_G9_1033SCRN_220408 TaxID=3144490 RepID=UPI0034A51401